MSSDNCAHLNSLCLLEERLTFVLVNMEDAESPVFHVQAVESAEEEGDLLRLQDRQLF